MGDFLGSLWWLLVSLGVLVTFHEFGHYWVARRCGVDVLRFSVGFGKPFYKKKRGDTEWCLAPIPLGGYVKMVDTREGNVAEADLPYAFDKQHPAKRIAIVVKALGIGFFEAAAKGGAILASKDLVERLDTADAQATGLDPDALAYTPLAELDGVSDKAIRDAGAIPVTAI